MGATAIAPPKEGVLAKVWSAMGWLLLALTVFYCLLYALPLALGGDCSFQLFTQGYCGSKSGLVLGAAFLLWPMAIFFAIWRPMLFPLSLYFLAMPFDELTNVNHVGTINKLLGILSMLAIIFVLFRHRKAVPPAASLLGWLAFLTWAGTSLMWSMVPAADNAAGPKLATTLLELVLLYAVLSITPFKQSELTVLTRFLIAGATLAAMAGVYLFRHGGALEQAGNLYARHVDLGSVGGAGALDMNQVGASLVLPFAFATMTVLQTKWGMRKLLWSIPFTVILLGMYITKSRGMIVGMVAILAYFWWKSRYRLQIGAVVAVGLLASLLAPAYHGDTIWARFANDQAGGSGRIYIWKVGFAAFKQHFLIGAGWGNFPFAYNRAFITVFQRYYEWWNRGSHNILLWVGVELGIVGILILLWALWTTFKSLNVIPPASKLYDMRVTLEGALIGLFVSSMFLDTLLEKYLWMTFALVAIARNVYLYAPDSDRALVEPKPVPRAAVLRPMTNGRRSVHLLPEPAE